jgi:hypothetical protein
MVSKAPTQCNSSQSATIEHQKSVSPVRSHMYIFQFPGLWGYVRTKWYEDVYIEIMVMEEKYLGHEDKFKRDKL